MPNCTAQTERLCNCRDQDDCRRLNKTNDVSKCPIATPHTAKHAVSAGPSCALQRLGHQAPGPNVSSFAAATADKDADAGSLRAQGTGSPSKTLPFLRRLVVCRTWARRARQKKHREDAKDWKPRAAKLLGALIRALLHSLRNHSLLETVQVTVGRSLAAELSREISGPTWPKQLASEVLSTSTERCSRRSLHVSSRVLDPVAIMTPENAFSKVRVFRFKRDDPLSFKQIYKACKSASCVERLETRAKP